MILGAQHASALFEGSSHSGRGSIFSFPQIVTGRGAHLYDTDGVPLVDFWQGHFSNILGHNSEVVRGAIEQALTAGGVTLLGVPSVLELECADVFRECLGLSAVRFFTSGSQATEYALRIARAITGRRLVLKGRGGWHGGNCYSLKSVRFPNGVSVDAVESRGLPDSVDQEVVLFDYNDQEQLHAMFAEYGDRLAVLIIEPVVGNSGMYPVAPEFLRFARELCSQYGTILIADEIVTGFRMGPGLFLTSLGIIPDIACVAKIAGGGFPLSALAANHELFQRARAEGVFFEGGTYCAHPLSLAVASAVLRHLRENATRIYPAIVSLAQKWYDQVSAILHALEIPAWIPNNPHVTKFPIMSLRLAHSREACCSEKFKKVIGHWDQTVCDSKSRDVNLKNFALSRNLNLWQGMGCLTAAHQEQDISFASEILREFFLTVRDKMDQK